MSSDIKITEAELKAFISEQKSMQAQLEEANTILSIREEELELLRIKTQKYAEKKSLLEGKETELQSLQVKLQQQNQERLGGEEREKELEKELQDSLAIYRQYAELFQNYTNVRVQLEDLESQLGEFKKALNLVQELRMRLGELESKLAILQGAGKTV